MFMVSWYFKSNNSYLGYEPFLDELQALDNAQESSKKTQDLYFIVKQIDTDESGNNLQLNEIWDSRNI